MRGGVFIETTRLEVRTNERVIQPNHGLLCQYLSNLSQLPPPSGAVLYQLICTGRYSFPQRPTHPPTHPSFVWIKPIVDGQKYHWGNEVENVFKKYPLKMGVTRVFVAGYKTHLNRLISI